MTAARSKLAKEARRHQVDQNFDTIHDLLFSPENIESEATMEDSPTVLGPENLKLQPPIGVDHDQLVCELSSTSIRSQRAKRRRRKRLPGQKKERWKNLDEQGSDKSTTNEGGETDEESERGETSTGW